MSSNNEIYEEITLYHSSKAQKKYIKNRKQNPEGILHLKYKRLVEQVIKPKTKPTKKKSTKTAVHK